MRPELTVLRPLERRLCRLVEAGVDDVELGRRFRRRPQTIRRVMALTQLPRSGDHLPGDVLRPVERRVLRWRADGASYDEIGSKFRRSAGFIRQIEMLALHKLHRAG